METKFQVLLRAVFNFAHKISSKIGLYSIRKIDDVARFFFEEHLKNEIKPKDPKNPKRYLHWRAFRPNLKKNERDISVYNVNKWDLQKTFSVGQKYIGSIKNEKVAGFASASIDSFCGFVKSAVAGCEIEAEFYPIPHLRHVNMRSNLSEAQFQLACQKLAKDTKKTLTDHSVHSGEYF